MGLSFFLHAAELDGIKTEESNGFKPMPNIPESLQLKMTVKQNN